MADSSLLAKRTKLPAGRVTCAHTFSTYTHVLQETECDRIYKILSTLMSYTQRKIQWPIHKVYVRSMTYVPLKEVFIRIICSTIKMQQ